MLELPKLWIDPPSPFPAGNGWARDFKPSAGAVLRGVRAGAGGALLGFACWRSAEGPGLWRWLVPPAVQVFETEDAALLCTLRHFWGLPPAWLVRDAEDRLVGSVRRTEVRDQLGRRLAAVELSPEEAVIRLRTTNGKELAVLHDSDVGTCVEFAPPLDGYPFTRMLVLAAALTPGVYVSRPLAPSGRET